MKIGIAFLTFGPDTFGGIERATHFLVRGLTDIGCDVLVLTSGAFINGCTSNGVRVAVVESLPTSFADGDGSILPYIKANEFLISRELLQLLSEELPDYLLVIDPLWGFIPLLDVWHQIRCPVGLYFHVAHPAETLDVVGAMPFSHFFAVSESLLHELRHLSGVLSNRNINILPNCINTAEFRRQQTAPSNAIFGNARLSKEKGTVDLIRAFALIAPLYPELLLWLCDGEFPFGDRQPGRAEADAMIQCTGIPADRIQFLPRLRWREIPKRVASARIVVIPSYKETFGMAALEAMAAGTPLIVSRSGNLPALVDDAALLVQAGNIDSIASAIRLLLSNHELRMANVQLGLNRAALFDAKRIARDFLSIVER